MRPVTGGAMDGSSWAALRDLLERALALPPAERDAFLAAQPVDDDVRAEVLALLAADDADADAGDLFLHAPTQPLPDVSSDAPTHPLREPAVGERVGRFTLVRLLGRGGMGTVWLAEQEQPRRSVALKMLDVRLGAGSARRRFLHESEILARLRHPGIAQVFEVGIHDVGGGDVPWFAMELVEGARDLVTWCRDAGLDRAARCRLFVEVCEAVQHGHERGVVHRDVKAANLLVDAEGRVKVIDFGVARVDAHDAGASMATLPGQIVGTLRSMSPEQIAGRAHDVDVRSDVYSLGLVLYELCCGRPPYALDGLPLAEVARTVQERPAARPTHDDADFPGDLEAILLKALEKDPARRYRSAGELGDDLQRFLDGEAVLARPPSAVHQLRLFTRRHRALVGGATVAALALLVATVVSSVFALRARDEALRAERALQAESAAHAQAERLAGREAALRAEAEDARDAEAVQRAAAESARDAEAQQRRRAETLFADQLALGLSLVLDVAERLRRLEGGTELTSDVLASSAEQLERLAAIAEPDDDEVRVALAEAHLRLGDALGNPMANAQLGDAAAAEAHYARAESLVDELAALRGDGSGTSDADVLRLRGGVLLRRGDLLFGGGDGTGARAVYARSLELSERRAGLLVDDPSALLDVAVAHNRIGRLDIHERRTVEGLDHFVHALERYDAAIASAGSTPDLVVGRAATLSKIGAALIDLRRDDEADAALAEVERAFLALAAERDGDAESAVGLAQAYRLRALVATRRGDLDEALRLARAGLSTSERLALSDPRNTRFPLLAGGQGIQVAQVLVMRARRSDDDADDLLAARETLVPAIGRLRELVERGAIPVQEAALLDVALGLRDQVDALLASSAGAAASGDG